MGASAIKRRVSSVQDHRELHSPSPPYLRLVLQGEMKLEPDDFEVANMMIKALRVPIFLPHPPSLYRSHAFPPSFHLSRQSFLSITDQCEWGG